ncbi:MAG TPA: hydroxysqualene dehydroxylase HpnE [Azospirillaceae bacterium]|nr:hydroxysqualene dehydroxylase HpnE [Azospirillaceae bacterium]
MSTIHVIGAGLAGLTAATRLAEAGRRVIVYEGAPQAGGRCRSFQDQRLDRLIDNGSHMVLGGNRAVLGYLRRIGALDRLTPVTPVAFPFIDLRTGEQWTVRPGRLVPGVRLAEHGDALKLLLAGERDSITDRLNPADRLFERLWRPLAVSGLNTTPERGSARLLRAILTRTFLRGTAACRPLMVRDGLSAAFIEPALRFLLRHGGDVRLSARVGILEMADGVLAAIHVKDERIALMAGDAVILAVPPWVAAELVPGLAVPAAGEAIVNAHFRLEGPACLPGGAPFLGLIGGEAEWLFTRGDVVSVTVSAADRLAERPSESVARLLWRDTARALALPEETLPPFRIVKERRATFDQTPAQAARRPGARTRIERLVLAGDWTETGLPATLEGAVQSGETAARQILRGDPAGRGVVRPFSGFPLPRVRHI